MASRTAAVLADAPHPTQDLRQRFTKLHMNPGRSPILTYPTTLCHFPFLRMLQTTRPDLKTNGAPRAHLRRQLHLRVRRRRRGLVRHNGSVAHQLPRVRTGVNAHLGLRHEGKEQGAVSNRQQTGAALHNCMVLALCNCALGGK